MESPTHTRFFEDCFGAEVALSVRRCRVRNTDGEGDSVPGYRISFHGEAGDTETMCLDDKEYEMLRLAMQRYPSK